MMQFIFLVEANKKSASDYHYISETLRRFYNILGHKITPIYMGGKGNYDKKETEINKNINKYKGKSIVFICYDIDNPINPSFLLNPKITAYATRMGYIEIWFYEDIEQAFIKRLVHTSEKTAVSNRFVSNNEINIINEHDLLQSTISKHNSSNILFVLDKYISRK